MKSKVVTIKELTDDNPTFCLSVLRVFNKCNECQHYKHFEYLKKLDKLKCKPHLNPEYMALIKEKQKVTERAKTIDEQIKNL